MSEWKPIETAPKDGTRILGWDGCEVVTLDYQPPYRYPEHLEYKEIWYQESDSGRASVFYPTHWMPLPEPPMEELQGGGPYELTDEAWAEIGRRLLREP